MGIGTPQTRCRETHQSGRFSTIPRMRSFPQAGTKPLRASISSMASSAALRMVVRPRPGNSTSRSRPIHHWSVARKMTGFLQRQQCG